MLFCLQVRSLVRSSVTSNETKGVCSKMLQHVVLLIRILALLFHFISSCVFRYPLDFNKVSIMWFLSMLSLVWLF